MRRNKHKLYCNETKLTKVSDRFEHKSSTGQVLEKRYLKTADSEFSSTGIIIVQ